MLCRKTHNCLFRHLSSLFKVKKLDDRQNKIYGSLLNRKAESLRNIGIIAHIDAGKTTTTERMLYFSGCIQTPGEVHYGNTKMDYLEQERRRGITIQAATITFAWNKHNINLIDTPGHIDFNAEVERSLRVLDGAVVILDGAQGVEPQTETVWEQAIKYNLPKICFINKMDRIGSSVRYSLESLKEILGVKPLLLNFPIGEESKFSGIIDIVSMKSLYYTDPSGLYVEANDLVVGDHDYKFAKEQQERLITELGEKNEIIADKYLSNEKITPEDIKLAIKDTLKDSNYAAVLFGSSLKNRGVQPLLDAIIDYLPSPIERGPIIARDTNDTVYTREVKEQEKLCAYAFKVIHDHTYGPITFVRVYSGSITKKVSLLNTHTKMKEKPSIIAKMLADEMVHTNSIGTGDIGVLIGCSHIRSGDTLISEGDSEVFSLDGVNSQPGVYLCSISCFEKRDENKLQKALSNIVREDPSISIKKEEETGQITLSCLGELQLEVMKERLLTEYKLKIKFGNIRVAYRESISMSNHKRLLLEKEHFGSEVFAELYINIEPKGTESSQLENEIVFNIQQKNQKETVEIKHNDPRFETFRNKTEVFESLDTLSEPYLVEIKNAISRSLESGELIGCPYVGVKVTITGGKWSNLRSTPN